MKLVLVQWRDARFLNEWEERHGKNKWSTIKCATAGILLDETKDAIKVCCHINEDHYAQAMAIPKAAIDRMWVLKTTKEIDNE